MSLSQDANDGLKFHAFKCVTMKKNSYISFAGDWILSHGSGSLIHTHLHLTLSHHSVHLCPSPLPL